MKDRLILVFLIFILLCVLSIINRFEQFETKEIKDIINGIDTMLDKVLGKAGDLSKQKVGGKVKKLFPPNKVLFNNIKTNIDQGILFGRNIAKAGTQTVNSLLGVFDLIDDIKNL